MRAVKGTDIDKRLSPRTLVLGIEIGDKSIAYPLSALRKQSPIMDTIGSTSIMLMLGEDKRSVRAFERNLDGRRLEFFQIILIRLFISSVRNDEIANCQLALRQGA